MINAVLMLSPILLRTNIIKNSPLGDRRLFFWGVFLAGGCTYIF